MRRKIALLLLCLCLLPLGGWAAETPDESLPILGLTRLSDLFEAGQSVSLSFSVEPSGYLGSDRAAIKLWSGLLLGVTARYRTQKAEDGSMESLAITGPESELLSLTHVRADGQEWVLSPDLPEALRAPEGSGLMPALLGESFSPWPTEAPDAVDSIPTWAEVLKDVQPNGSAEEGYAALLTPGAGKDLLLALPGLVDLGLLSELPGLLCPPDRLTLGAEPVSLFWREGTDGLPGEVRLVADVALEEGGLWNVTLSLAQKPGKNQQGWELKATATKGEDTVNLSLTSKTTHSGHQVKRQYRWKADGTSGGYAFTVDLRQNDTNTYTLKEGRLSEKLTRSMTLATTSRDPEVVARNRGALALTYTEKGTMVSAAEDFAYEGAIDLECKNGADTLLAGRLPFTLAVESPLPLPTPTDARDVDPGDAAELSDLEAQGRALLEKALVRWLSGTDEQTRKLLLPES